MKNTLLYKRLAGIVEEGGIRLVLKKIWMRLFSRFDQNYFFHPTPHGVPAGDLEVIIHTPTDADRAIAERILRAYQKAAADEKQFAPAKAYQDAWDDNRNVYHDDLLKLLEAGNASYLAEHLSNMHRHKSTYGVSGSVIEYQMLRTSSYQRKKWAALMKDTLVAFAEALAILPYETAIPYTPKKNIYADADWIIQEIEKKIGIDIAPAIADGGLHKLKLKKGLFCFRDLWSLYAAWRLSIVAGKESGIGEIGGGLGKTAVYAERFGFSDYSFFDLPVMNVMTAWHLIKALPSTRTVVLYGELDQREAFRVLPYWEFGKRKHDIVVNQDSFPEMGKEIAENYIRDIKKVAHYFFSINHEHQAPLFPGSKDRNLFVPPIVEGVGGYQRLYRFPYWLRKGYVEELYKVSN